MHGTKAAFSTDYHPQTNGLVERMIRKMENIIRIFCAYGMEHKAHEGYTQYWVTLLPEIQLDYNIIQHSTTLKSPSLVEKRCNPLTPVGHLYQALLTILAKTK
ncbi:hypothetical protein O181_012147 [Austropuccinia psidii MF-1]|uniref:Integrase catalytic domain-containing protein n=1 Tax=Austropuccinia psidii MF-1 TaxID=1389203 RepID=A0A9Q3BVX4_9BASI|nr:hypothetical protein [Austropuccinia psidii MF-1]